MDTSNVTFGIALLGAVLGIINTWKAYDRDKPKLRVRPRFAVMTDDQSFISDSRSGAVSHYKQHNPLIARFGFCVEVINRSTFALIIDEVGFQRAKEKKRDAVSLPVIRDGKPFPRRLEPRESACFYMELPRPLEGKRLKYAYARTACGLTFKATSLALKECNYPEKILGDLDI